MNRFPYWHGLVAGWLPLALCCGCLPATQPEGKASLQAQQAQASTPPSPPPLQTSLAPEEQEQFRLGYAKLLLDSGREVEAEALLDKLRYNDQLAPEAYPLLAKIYERQNRPSDALLAWKKALSLREGDPELMGRVGRAALVCKEYPLADEIFNQWLTHNPVGSRLYVSGLNNLGFSSLLQKRYEQASRFFDQAITLDPLDKRAKANLALLDQVRTKGPTAMAPDLGPGQVPWSADDPTPLSQHHEERRP